MPVEQTLGGHFALERHVGIRTGVRDNGLRGPADGSRLLIKCPESALSTSPPVGLSLALARAAASAKDTRRNGDDNLARSGRG